MRKNGQKGGFVMNAIDKKVILLFSDLEGTLLRESDGQYDDEAMFHFLEQLDKLEKNTDSKIHLHIVSPVDLTSMKNILKKLDNNICNYNSIKKSNLSIPKGAIEHCNIKCTLFYIILKIISASC